MKTKDLKLTKLRADTFMELNPNAKVLINIIADNRMEVNTKLWVTPDFITNDYYLISR